jgi:hypothetical protein
MSVHVSWTEQVNFSTERFFHSPCFAGQLSMMSFEPAYSRASISLGWQRLGPVHLHNASSIGTQHRKCCSGCKYCGNVSMIEPDESHSYTGKDPGPRPKLPVTTAMAILLYIPLLGRTYVRLLHKSVEVLLYASRQVNIQFQTKIDALFESRNHILAFEFFESWRLCRSQFRFAWKLHPTTGDHEIIASCFGPKAEARKSCIRVPFHVPTAIYRGQGGLCALRRRGPSAVQALY